MTKGRCARSALLVAVTAMGATLASGVGPWIGASEAKELIFNSYAPRQTPVYKVLFEDFSKTLTEETKGSITINIPAATLAGPEQQFQIVTQGAADVVNVGRYSQREIWRLPAVAELPFNSTTSTAASVALNRTYQKHFAEIGEFKDVKLITFSAFPGVQYITDKKPIKTVDDFNGLKLWAAAGPLAFSAEAMGATVVPAPFPKLFEFASKGTIEGMVMTPGSAFAAGIADYANHVTVVPGGVGSLTFALVMNKDTWAGLSDEEKAIVDKAASALPIKFGKAMDGFEKAVRPKLNASIVPADEALLAEISKRLAPAKDQWLKSAEQAGLKNPQGALDFYRAELAKVDSQSQ